MDNRRLILLMIFGFSLIMLWEGWQKHSQQSAAVTAGAPGSSGAPVPATPAGGSAAAVPTPTVPKAGGTATTPAVPVVAPSALVQGQRLVVTTDLYRAEIAAQGGDLVRLELLKHPDTDDKKKPIVLFDDGRKHTYLAQSGLIGEGMPTHKTIWQLPGSELALKDGQDALDVVLVAGGPGNAKVTKTLSFRRGVYQIGVAHAGGTPGAHAYYQITRDGKPSEGETNPMMGVSTFTGPAVYTDQEKFQKVEFADIAKAKAKFAQKADNGWLAMVQHYFVAALLPEGKTEREFFMRKVGEDMYAAGVILPVGADGGSRLTLYAGPQEQDKLEKIAPGLELVVDYGWLTVIAAPLFWVLGMFHKLLGNWGWAIIGLTVLIKLAFFPLSAASYKSMAKMRVMAPKLQKLKETYGDDKQRLNTEMMELYKREKINPFGGCLPILVQIPVFIALYWVLLGAVEMRNAPWLGWITDLSVKDPYYVLPLIMGVTMIVQTKLNPTPPDPMQEKIMLIMPVVFTGMFLFFPAGLVLYWVINNLLSIAQQWQITRMMEAGQAK